MRLFVILSAILSTLLITNLQAKENEMAKNPVVTIETTEGNIEITLMPGIAPKTVENFVTHAKNGYYNGTIFHRVIKDFMIQGGDPLGNGTGGESIWGDEFKDEFSTDVSFDKPGILAMANRGPNTNGSQFFITTASTPWLDGRHTIFGEVTEGYKIVDKIQNLETTASDKPKKDVKIKKITVN
jgi:peptidylprolyl isomerase